MTDSIIFDLDGTLWDATASCALAWNKALQKMQIGNVVVTTAMAAAFAGKRLETIYEEYFPF